MDVPGDGHEIPHLTIRVWVVLLGERAGLCVPARPEEDRYLMYSKEQILEILEAYDLTKSFRSAAALVGCDHHTVARYVAARAVGLDPAVGIDRPSVTEGFVDKIHEWVDRSDGRIRADVVHDKLEAMGYPGSERTTRRVVAVVKEQWRRDSHRVYMPWITEPGLWLQWDYASGPWLAGQRVVLFVAWLAWARFRVVVPLRDRSMPSVIAALDATFRRLGGAPTFALTDNEKTVTDRHIAGIAVRNPQIVAVGHYYGLTIATCVPADPESKGGSESTVRLAKADLVPTEHNLLDGYTSWEQLVAACDAFMDTVNARVHRATGERAGRSARDRTRPSPCGPEHCVHGRVRRDPGGRLVLDVEPSRRPLLGAARVGRSAGVGPCRRRPARRGRHPDLGTGRDRPSPPRRSGPGQLGPGALPEPTRGSVAS